MLNTSLIEKPAAFWVRPLVSTDMSDIVEHLLRLNSYDRHLRFFCTLSDDTIRRLIEDRLNDKHVHFLGVYLKDRLIGVGQLAGTAEMSEIAELGVSVDADFRSKGIGAELVRHAISHAGRRGYQEISLSIMPENVPMKRLARRFAFQFRHRHSQVTAHLKIASAKH